MLWLKIVSFVLFRKSLVSYVDELSQTIRKNLENESRVSAHNRLELLLSALVGLVINQRDIVTGQYCTHVAYMHFLMFPSMSTNPAAKLLTTFMERPAQSTQLGCC